MTTAEPSTFGRPSSRGHPAAIASDIRPAATITGSSARWASGGISWVNEATAIRAASTAVRTARVGASISAPGRGSRQGARTQCSRSRAGPFTPLHDRAPCGGTVGQPSFTGGTRPVADLLLLTPTVGGSAQALPALGLLGHKVRVLPVEPSALLDAPDADVLLLDARRDLATARSTCRLLRATGLTVPLVLVLTEGGMTVVTAEWGAADILLEDASPAEVEARLRLVIERSAENHPDEIEEISSGELSIDAGGY